MIVSFGDRTTEDLYHNRPTHRLRQFPPKLMRLAWVKLDILDSAATLLDLRSPPGNRLEALRGNLAGFYCIRVNQQWRLIFRWQGNNAYAVRLVDYHS